MSVPELSREQKLSDEQSFSEAMAQTAADVAKHQSQSQVFMEQEGPGPTAGEEQLD